MSLFILFLSIHIISLYTASTVNINAHCRDGHIDGCIYDTPYLPLYKNDNRDGLTMKEAQILCQSTYNTELATIDESITNIISITNQFNQMRDLCKSAGPNQPCWTSGERNTNNRNEFIFDNNFNISTNRDENLLKYGEYFLAEGEGNGNNEECIALYHAKDYYMTDWPCNDDKGVKIALCQNPAYDINNKCLCNCAKCTVYGDPHIYTFDDLYYHAFAGECMYYYMTPCFDGNYNENMPIDIFAEHSRCNDGLSRCIKTIYVQLYDRNGNEMIMFKFEHMNFDGVWLTNVQNMRNGIDIDNDWSDNIILDQVTKFVYLEQNPWSYLLHHDDNLQIFELRIWTKSEIESVKVIIRDITGSEFLKDAYFEISASECFMGETCGLCGYYDGNKVDDFIRINPKGSSDYIDNTDIDDYTKQNSFDRVIEYLSNWKYIGQYAPTNCNMTYDFYDDSVCNIANYVSNVADFSCVPNCSPNKNKCDVSGIAGSDIYGIQLQETCLYDFCKCLGLNLLQQYNWNRMLRTLDRDNLVVVLKKEHCFDIPKKMCCNPKYCPLQSQNEEICRFNNSIIIPTPNPTELIQENVLCDVDGASSTYSEMIENEVYVNGGKIRHIQSTGCPNHINQCIGKIDICIDGETEAIELNKNIKIPAFPCFADKVYDVKCVGGDIGIMLNGVSIFSPFGGNIQICNDAVEDEAYTYDKCGGHATAKGEYHYHLSPGCLLDQLGDAHDVNINGHSPQIGWAFDGFPIYGPHGMDGGYIYRCGLPDAKNSDCLDECNGHSHHVIDGFKYHYHITGPVGDLITDPLFPIPRKDMFPYSIGCLKGVPFDWNKSKCNGINGYDDSYTPRALNGITNIYLSTTKQPTMLRPTKKPRTPRPTRRKKTPRPTRLRK